MAIGLYSPYAAKKHGSFIWVNERGKEVEVSAVLNKDEKNIYNYGDAEDRGEVASFVRLGNPGEEEHTIFKTTTKNIYCIEQEKSKWFSENGVIN